MILSADLTRRLLGAIETDSLVFLCGSGLSMAPPSDLLSAQRVSQICYDKWLPIENLDPALRNDVARLAGHFHTRGDFERRFIRLVPWNDLMGPPNSGHAAIADLLISRGAHAALSANFDIMIEHWAADHRVAMRGALTGQEAEEFISISNPLIKFHGCLQRYPEETLWTPAQLNDAVIKDRITSCSQWINLHIPGKDIVVIGFWTDWAYLNDVLGNALGATNANSVTVIDTGTTAALQAKAPDLWAKLSSLSRDFEHVQASGADALEELRAAYSKTWARKFYAQGADLMQGEGVPVTIAAPFDGLGGAELYNLRRDAEGVPYTRAATRKAPSTNATQTAVMHVLLLNAGARNLRSWLQHGGQSIRIVNGAGLGLTEVQASYNEPPSIPQSDVVICAGAFELGVPAKVIASGRGSSTVRPAPGGGARWLTFETARAEFGL